LQFPLRERRALAGPRSERFLLARERLPALLLGNRTLLLEVSLENRLYMPHLSRFRKAELGWARNWLPWLRSPLPAFCVLARKRFSLAASQPKKCSRAAWLPGTSKRWSAT